MGCCSGLLSWHVGVWHCVLGRFLVISSCASKMDQSGVLKIGSFPFVSIFYKIGELPLPVRIVFAKVLSLKSICNPLIWVFRAGLDRAPSCVYTSLWLSLTADGSSVEFGATPCLRLCLTLPIIHILLSRFGIYFKLIIFCVLNLALESTAERNAGNSRVYIQHTRFSSSNSQITKNVELEQLSWAMTRVLGLIFIVRVQDYMHIHVCMYVNINIYVHIIYIEYTVKTVLAVTFALRPPGHSGHFCRSL